MVRARFAVAVLATLALPALAQAKGFGRRGGSSNSSSSSSSSSNGHAAAPVGTPHAATPNSSNRYYSGGNYYSGGRYYGGRSYYGGGYYRPDYYYWGVHPWGYYGWGYYPVYGGPAVYAEAPPPAAVTSNAFVGGLFTRDGAGLSLKLGIDGREWGGNFDLVTLPSVDPNDPSLVTAMPLIKGHITYSIVSDLHARVRLEGGMAGIGAPDVTYIGPDVGASATLALAGPLALEGAAHWMPVPASILDLEGAVGLNFGALGIRGGWRWVRLDDSRQQGGGTDIYNGPMISLGVLF